MTDYYSQKLSADRLRRCYELASPRVQQYLEAEIRHLISRIKPQDKVLELGCGYGRVAFRLAGTASQVVGIDVAPGSIAAARRLAEPGSRCAFHCMDALDLQFEDASFDIVACVQNGICAFRVDEKSLLAEALRVARPGGRVLFSSYSDKIWPDRLAWFEAQAAEGLLGPIDHAACRNGVIVCEDGFQSGSFSPEAFRALCAGLGVSSAICEVDDSSIFCEIIRPGAPQEGPGPVRLG
jgi:2-polyprenyl-6-hydroxyphenyl methylase/3-demethylubiquinone-9 3-methyltransferase